MVAEVGFDVLLLISGTYLDRTRYKYGPPFGIGGYVWYNNNSNDELVASIRKELDDLPLPSSAISLSFLS